MGEAGILDEDSRVELIEGELIEMSPIGTPHASTIDELNHLFVRRTDAIVRIQNPIVLGEHSEPEPDIVLAKRIKGGYAKAHPGPKDILLIVEVSDTTLEYDLRVKVPLYARFKVAEVWILDIQNSALEIFREPGATGYRQTLKPSMKEKISPTLLPKLKLTGAELLRR